MTDVVNIEQPLVGDAARTLAAAFASDPIFAWMSRGRTGLDQRLQHGFAAMLRAEMRRKDPLLFATSDGGCAAIWHPVDGWKASIIDSLRVVPGFVRSFGLRVDRVARVQTSLERQHPKEPHYHLAFIGTRPTQQGRGLGARVLNEMTDRCDNEGTPAFLESSNPRNEALYVRHGFVATGQVSLPDGCPPVTSMWRDPR